MSGGLKLESERKAEEYRLRLKQSEEDRRRKLVEHEKAEIQRLADIKRSENRSRTKWIAIVLVGYFLPIVVLLSGMFIAAATRPPPPGGIGAWNMLLAVAPILNWMAIFGLLMFASSADVLLTKEVLLFWSVVIGIIVVFLYRGLETDA